MKVVRLFSLVKFSHTIFALPFALASMLLAAGGLPPARTFLLIVVCMVAARTAAMAFNRYLDAGLDARNPRTATREIPRGLISKKLALGIALGSALLFIVAAGAINRLSLILSPVALGILFFYSFTKRFSDFSHLFLGLCLGIAPVGAWIAVTGAAAFPPVLLGLAVIFWVAGFDVIYATQDHDFDRREGLHSLVVRWGVSRALTAARGFHAVSLVLLVLFGGVSGIGWSYYLAVALIGLLFLYEHSLVSGDDLSRVNAAFFNVNGFISLLFLAGVILSIGNPTSH